MVYVTVMSGTAAVTSAALSDERREGTIYLSFFSPTICVLRYGAVSAYGRWSLFHNNLSRIFYCGSRQSADLKTEMLTVELFGYDE